MTRQWHKLALLGATMLFAVGVMGDTFTGKPDPYNKTVTITIPTGTYLRPDAALSTTSSVYASEGIVSDAGISARSATVSGQIYSSVGVVSDGGLSSRSASVSGTIYSSESIISDGGLSTRSASVSSNMVVTGSISVDGGINFQGGGSLRKLIAGNATVYVDGGANVDTCSPDYNIAASGLTGTEGCFMAAIEGVGENYNCEIHPLSSSGDAGYIHTECCCHNNPNCPAVAPTTGKFFCFE